MTNLCGLPIALLVLVPQVPCASEPVSSRESAWLVVLFATPEVISDHGVALTLTAFRGCPDAGGV